VCLLLAFERFTLENLLFVASCLLVSMLPHFKWLYYVQEYIHFANILPHKGVRHVPLGLLVDPSWFQTFFQLWHMMCFGLTCLLVMA
jgi:hypothetical protein